MPIKFRCKYCKQFLGISRSKAGEVVDCPTCGRTLRVPQLDGKIAPLPKLKLDLKDSSLANAMDELAALANAFDEEPAEEAVSSPSKSQYALAHNYAHDEIEIPEAPSFYHGKESNPVIEEEPEEPSGEEFASPVTPQIIDMAPLASPEPIEIKPVEPEKEPQSEPVTSKEFVSAEMEQLAEQHLPAEPPSWQASFTQPSTFEKFSQKIKSSITLIMASLLIGLLLGWLGGAMFSTGNGTKGTESDIKQIEKSAQNKNEKGHQLSSVPNTGTPSIQGRITYKTEQQSTRPDKGARVIVLPESRKGEAKISYIGFRGGDSPTDFEVAEAALHVLGGDAAIVNEKGEYEIHLPEAGRYHIIVISHFQSRDVSVKVDVALRGTLRGYFDRPEQLLGKLAYRFEEINFDGEETELKDVTFNSTP